MTKWESNTRFQIQDLLHGKLILGNSRKCFTPHTTLWVGVMTPSLQMKTPGSEAFRGLLASRHLSQAPRPDPPPTGAGAGLARPQHEPTHLRRLKQA